MNSTGAFSPFLRADLTISNIEVIVTPFWRAFKLDF